jgi:RNase P subunit RPR2
MRVFEMKKFCKKCGAMLEQAEEEDQNLKIKRLGKISQYCLECASSIRLAEFSKDQHAPVDLES